MASSLMNEKEKRNVVVQVGHSERFHDIWNQESSYTPLPGSPLFD